MSTRTNMSVKRLRALKQRVMTYLSQSNYSEIDAECVNLCKAINKIPGLFTVLSCCGHGTLEFRIIFRVIDLNDLPILLSCIYENCKWTVDVHADFFKSLPMFTLWGPIGDLDAAQVLAKELNDQFTRIKNGEE